MCSPDHCSTVAQWLRYCQARAEPVRGTPRRNAPSAARMVPCRPPVVVPRETHPGLALAFSVLGRRCRVVDRRSCPLAAGGDLGQTPVEPLAKFVGVIVVLGPALAGDDHAGGGDAREAGDSD
jgi:hypothetical protein